MTFIEGKMPSCRVQGIKSDKHLNQQLMQAGYHLGVGDGKHVFEN